MRRHLTSANVLSTLAVFLVLTGGTALAVGLPKNSVTGASVKNNSLRSADLADGSGVSGADVTDGSLGGADFGNGSVPGGKLGAGLLGAADLAAGAVGSADVAPGSVGQKNLSKDLVDSASVLNNSLRGADVANNALDTSQIVESSLAQVPETATLLNRAPRMFLSSEVHEVDGPFERGQAQADGSFTQSFGCPAGEQLISGGPNSASLGSTILESVHDADKWKVAVIGISPGNTWSIHVICSVPRKP